MWQTDGFVQGNVKLDDALRRLSSHINNVPEKLREFSKDDLLNRPAPGKWSRQEILGHLIDSAINNLKRFTEIQFLPQPYMVQSYQQEQLVFVNNYQRLPLEHLLNLWQALNRQILYVAQQIPNERLQFPVNPQYDNNEMKNLEWIITDYVAHMEHHFRQIWRES